MPKTRKPTSRNYCTREEWRAAQDRWSAQAPSEIAAPSGSLRCDGVVGAGDALAAALQDIRIMLYGLALDARQAVIAQKAIDRAKLASAQWHAARSPNTQLSNSGHS